MSKELDYLDDILNYQSLTLGTRTIIERIKEKIQRLEAIDNATPSEFKIVNYKGQYYLQINVNDDEATQIQLPLLEDEIQDVQLAIDKFKQINRANPSEVLECLEIMRCNLPHYYVKEYNTVKQELLKKQEQEELLGYIIRFIEDAEISDNGVCYVSFKNDTPYLDCIEMDKGHYNKLIKIKESQKGE